MGEQDVPKNECGGCTVCCTALRIEDDELAKPAGVTCHHCTPTGCGIYQTRPATCRGFHCGWLLLPALNESWRPDRSGVLIGLIEPDDLPEEFRAAGNGLHFTVLGGDASISRPGFADYVATLVRRDVAVWLSAGTPKTLINAYLKPAASAHDRDGVIAMLLHIYGLHLQLRESQGLKPVSWVSSFG